MPLYSARIDCLENVQSDFERYCLQRPDYNGRCFCVLECATISEKMHVHIILEDSRSLSAVRAELLKKFPRDGKAKQYSIKDLPQTDLRNAEQYLCKGGNKGSLPIVVYSSDHYTDETIKSLHDAYWIINDSIKSRNTISSFSDIPVVDSVVGTVSKAVVKKSKKFLVQVCERIEASAEKNIVWNIKEHCKIWHDTLIVMHGRHFVPYNAHQIDKEMNSLAAYFCPLEMIYESKKQLSEFHLPWSEWL